MCDSFCFDLTNLLDTSRHVLARHLGLARFFAFGRFTTFAFTFAFAFAFAFNFVLVFVFGFDLAFAFAFALRVAATAALRSPTMSQMLVPALASQPASFCSSICAWSSYAICAMWKLPDASSSGSSKC